MSEELEFNEGALTVLAQEPPMQLVEQEDAGLAASIALPQYKDVDDVKVVRSVKDVFKGFSDATDIKFETVEALGDYVEQSMESIKKTREKSEAADLCNRAAAMARLWYLGATIDKSLTTSSYGANASQRLATQLHRSVPWIYQIRAVSTKLSVVDCYLLGVRGLGSKHLCRLAQVKDDSIRRAIVDTFVTSVRTSDPVQMEAARRNFVAAINSDQKLSTLDMEGTDPYNGGTAEEASPEYSRLMKSVNNWRSWLKRPASEDGIEELCSAANDFFLPASLPDAQARLDEVKGAALELKALMATVRNNLDDAIRDLGALQDVELNS